MNDTVATDEAAEMERTDGGAGRWWLAAVLAIVVLATGVRAWQLHRPSFDADEVFELLYATTDLGELITRRDGFPPVYRMVVGAALGWTGDDRAARWVSVVIGVLTVGAIAALARQMAGTHAGLAAAALLAISSCHFYLSQHARAYALYVLLCSLVLLAAWRLRPERDREPGDTGRWLTLVGVSWIAMATHYLAALLIALLGVLLVAERRGPQRWRALGYGALLAVLAAPLTVCLLGDIAEAPGYKFRVGFDKEAYAFSYFWLVSGYTFGPSVSELRELAPAAAFNAILPWATAIAAIVGVLSWNAWGRLGPRGRLWIGVLMLAPPPMAAVLSAFLQTGYNYRYIVWMLIPMTVALAAGATVSAKRPLASLATVGLVLLGLLGIVNRHTNARYFENDFQAAKARIEANTPAGVTPVILASPKYYGESVRYAMPEDWDTRLLTMNPVREQNWTEALEDLDGAGRPVWLIREWYPEQHPRAETGRRMIDELGAEFVERSCPNLELFRLPDTPPPTRVGAGAP